MEVHMASDMEVGKVADKVADMVADMAADKKNWGYPIWQEEEGYPILQEEEKRVPNLVRELVTGVGWLGPNFFDPNLTRLACLLSFASFFTLGLVGLVGYSHIRSADAVESGDSQELMFGDKGDKNLLHNTWTLEIIKSAPDWVNEDNHLV